jgi:hypothetical protein
VDEEEEEEEEEEELEEEDEDEEDGGAAAAAALSSPPAAAGGVVEGLVGEDEAEEEEASGGGNIVVGKDAAMFLHSSEYDKPRREGFWKSSGTSSAKGAGKGKREDEYFGSLQRKRGGGMPDAGRGKTSALLPMYIA